MEKGEEISEGEVGGFVLVNDSRHAPDGRFVCGGEPVVHEDYWEAMNERDKLRERYDNPYIHVYPVLADKAED